MNEQMKKEKFGYEPIFKEEMKTISKGVVDLINSKKKFTSKEMLSLMSELTTEMGNLMVIQECIFGQLTPHMSIEERDSILLEQLTVSIKLSRENLVFSGMKLEKENTKTKSECVNEQSE